MGTSLSVKVDGSWETVLEPYIKVDDTWKNIHKIHIKHGGEWEVAHKTDKNRYFIDVENQIENSTGGTWTVPENGTRYIRTELIGGGGSAGGGIRTGGAGLSGGHFTCPSGSFSGTKSTEYATGGDGGGGRILEVWFEVAPGNYLDFDVYGGGIGGAAGIAGTPLELPYAGTITPAGTTKYGSNGREGNAMYLDVYHTVDDPANSVDPFLSLAAHGGSLGGGGYVRVDSNCTHASGLLGYNASAITGSTGAAGGKTIETEEGYSIEETVFDEDHENGGGGNSNANGDAGQDGYISIWPYRP